MQVQPYLNFDGLTEEALAFYGKALGGKVTMLMRMNESPEPHPPGMVPPGAELKVMHAAFQVGGTVLLASDMKCGGKPRFEGITMSLQVESDAEATRCYSALAEGGKVGMPLAKTFFASSFGTLTDRFGLSWMIMAGPTN
jgi:PhnB protein